LVHQYHGGNATFPLLDHLARVLWAHA